MINSIILGDCLEVMKDIPDACVDMILCDLPYGTTDLKWDSIIDLNTLWGHYNRVIKPNRAIVLTAQQPFTTTLINSNPDMFKYLWVWVKSYPQDFLNAKYKPMKKHEDVLIFSTGANANGSKRNTPYYPQNLIKINKERSGLTGKKDNTGLYKIGHSIKEKVIQEFTNWPTDVLVFKSEQNRIHPTQKPVPLFEYLIKTYTQEGGTVLDNCIGSGTTAIACMNANRQFIGIEKDPDYYNKAIARIEAHNPVYRHYQMPLWWE